MYTGIEKMNTYYKLSFATDLLMGLHLGPAGYPELSALVIPQILCPVYTIHTFPFSANFNYTGHSNCRPLFVNCYAHLCTPISQYCVFLFVSIVNVSIVIVIGLLHNICCLYFVVIPL